MCVASFCDFCLFVVLWPQELCNVMSEHLRERAGAPAPRSSVGLIDWRRREKEEGNNSPKQPKNTRNPILFYIRGNLKFHLFYKFGTDLVYWVGFGAAMRCRTQFEFFDFVTFRLFDIFAKKNGVLNNDILIRNGSV